jgi:hypothetical protein
MTVATKMAVAVTDLRPGDYIDECPPYASDAHNFLTVSRVNRKVKFAEVEFDLYGKNARWAMDAQVHIIRQVETDDEIKAQKFRSAVRRIEALLPVADKARHLTMKAVETYDAFTTTHDAPAYPVLTQHQVQDILMAQVEGQFWGRVQFAAAKYVSSGVDSDTALLAGFQQTVNQPQYPTNPLSRSSNALSNMFEDLERYMCDKMAHDHNVTAFASVYATALKAAEAIVEAARS